MEELPFQFQLELRDELEESLVIVVTHSLSELHAKCIRFIGIK